ncbi:MAG: 50S ribosomal protein L18 [Myxococcota bacterium]
MGTTEMPRLSVFRSARHIYAQVIDDTKGMTLATASTRDKEFKEQFAGGKKSDAALFVGKLIAKRCLEKKIEAVVFDRNGFLYHGRVSKLADGARSGGLKF